MIQQLVMDVYERWILLSFILLLCLIPKSVWFHKVYLKTRNMKDQEDFYKLALDWSFMER